MYTRQNGRSRRVVTPDGPAHLHVHLVGPHPILQHFLDRMEFSRIVASCLSTPREWILDHAQSLAILVQNIILSPAPLYRIAEWAAPIDPLALQLSPKEKDSLNDDRLARSLDALATPRARSLFFRLALHIIEQFELETQRIHQDTTTVTFHGQYAGSKREPRITHGVNKDHRPDLKQLVFGLNVTADGAVPISHEVYSGNRTDDVIHCSNWDRIRQILGREDFIYVADSKLCTKKNLKHIAAYGGSFVSVLPRSRAENKRFSEKLHRGERVRWRRLVEMESSRGKTALPVIYWTTADGPTKTEEGYRIIWYRSSAKEAADAEARETALQKAEAELFDLEARLNRGNLKTQSAIHKNVQQILQTHECQTLLQVKISYTVQRQVHYLRSGRPKKGDPCKITRTRIFRLEVRRDEDAIRADARTDGIFPLVTNLAARQAPKKEVLLIYKYQPYVEKRHALFKSELGVAPIYIKKPQRAAGLVHANFLAMTLDALIERSLRRGMQRERIKQLPILPEGRMTATPTTARLLEMFSDVSWYEFEQGGDTVTFPIQLSPLQRRLLRLLEVDPAIYA